MIRDCLVLTCFLENIDTRNVKSIARILKTFENYTLEEVAHYYQVNTEIKNIRVERLLAETNGL